MAWLHSWTGLLFGWLMFAIFLMGSVSYYRHEITQWMQPHYAAIQIQQDQAVQTAYAYLQHHAPDAKQWFISVADAKRPVNQVFWEKSDGGFERKTLSADTGAEVTSSPTLGGDFFYQFHYQLFGVPVMIGRMITTLAAFIMLIALVSGIITHKKILTDFFTLRVFKGQRSYLDFHNISSVLGIPFFLTITFTGIAIFFYVYLPWGMKAKYPDNPFKYFEEIRFSTALEAEKNSPAIMKPIDYFLKQTQQAWRDTEYSVITVKNPNTNNAQISITATKDQSISLNKAQMSFHAITGQAIGNTRNQSAIATLSYSMSGLHMATFAQPFLRMMFFFSGILGSVMIASGLLLWSLKRQIQNKNNTFHVGHYLVNRLNIAALLGLPIAMLAYFYSNRLITLNAQGPNYEIYTFFGVWLLSFLSALFFKQQWLWKSFLKVFIMLALVLPIFNVSWLIQHQYIQGLSSYWVFLKVDLMIFIFALLALFLHNKIEPIQRKATAKIKNKLAQKEAQEST